MNEKLDIEKITSHQKIAKRHYWRAFFIGIGMGIFICIFMQVLFNEKFNSKSTAFVTFLLLGLLSGCIAPWAKRNSLITKWHIEKEFSKKLYDFSQIWAHGKISTDKKNQLLTNKYYRWQLAMAALLGYYLISSIVLFSFLASNF